MIGVIVMRLLFVIDFGQRDSFATCCMELIDCEEESESEHLVDDKEFCEQIALKFESAFDKEAVVSFSFDSWCVKHIIEIVSPPPRG
jgi:hypothetical protein